MQGNALRNVAIASLFLFGAALPAQAIPMTWNLDNVTFSDGASASGSFTIDAAAQTWTGFHIETTGGVLSAFTYDPTNSGLYFNGFGPNAFSIIPGNGARYLTFSFLDALTDAGGTRAINTVSSWECMNCSPWRYINGSVTTASVEVPEPGTLVMLVPALGMLGWMSRRRKRVVAR